MQVGSISSLASALGVQETSTAKESSGFSDIFTQALSDAQSTDAADKASALAIVSGEDIDLHTALIASEKAELALSLAIQLRNKIIDAYKEIMNMQL